MCHVESQCYLPPDKRDIPALTPAKAGTWLSDPKGLRMCDASSVSLSGALLKWLLLFHDRLYQARCPSQSHTLQTETVNFCNMLAQRNLLRFTTTTCGVVPSRSGRSWKSISAANAAANFHKVLSIARSNEPVKLCSIRQVAHTHTHTQTQQFFGIRASQLMLGELEDFLD